MKNKLKYLVNMSLKRKIKTKWFLIANILLALVIVGVFNIDHIISAFGGDFDTKTKIYVVDNTNKSYDLFISYVEQSFSLINADNNYEFILSDKTKDETIDIIKTNSEEITSLVLVFDDSEDNVIDVSMISNDYVDTMDMTYINNAVNNVKVYLAVEKYNISEEQIKGLTANVEIQRTILNEDKNTEEENMQMIMTTVFPIIILPFFMLSIFLVQMIGAEVNDEKTTRGMEIIISNVSPKVHFFSKCIAGNLFILIQGALLILYVILGIFIRTLFTSTDSSVILEITNLLGGVFSTSFIESLKYIIPFVLILKILTFIGYSLLAAILSSMTTNTEDFQQIQTPIMMINLIGYYLAIMAGTFEGSIFIKILGYVPFISAILSPSLLVMNQFSIVDVIISILLMVVVIYLLIKYGLKIYKVGILNYSSGNLFKKMFKALKD